MRFDARPVVRRRLTPKHLALTAALAAGLTLAALAAVQLYLREKAVAKVEAEQLQRRLFYVLTPGETISVAAADVSDRLIASMVVRNRLPRTDVHLKIEWHDRDGHLLAPSPPRTWRRSITEKTATTGAESLERYLLPGGDPLAGPRNLTLRRDDFPSGTHTVTFQLLAPADVPVFVRFYTRAQLQPGAQHQESALLEKRERRLEARTALPSSLAPQELLDRLTGWKWNTVAAEGASRQLHLFRREMQGDEADEGGEDEAPAVEGLRVGPAKPLAFPILVGGDYELRRVEGGEGEIEVERRVPGKLPERERVLARAEDLIWKGSLGSPSTLVVRKEQGQVMKVRLLLVPPGGLEPLWVPSATNPSVSWLIGPAAEVKRLRALAAAVPPREVEGAEALRFEFSPRAAERMPTLRLRVRAVHGAGEVPPLSVALRYRIGGAGRLALAEERLEVPLSPGDLERIPMAWGAPDLEEPGVAGRPTYAVTGPGDLYIDVPDEARFVEVRAEAPALVIPTHTVPGLRPTLAVPEESPDRTLCWLDPESPDDARVWHYLRPANEPALRSAAAAVVVDIPMPPVAPPLRGAASADALWDREAAMPHRHAGSALALWPARPRGAIAKTRLFPWSAPWPGSAYRPLPMDEIPVSVLYEPGLPDPADVLVPDGAGVLRRWPFVAGPWRPGTVWINRPAPGDLNPDPRLAAMLRRAWRALPDVSAAFEIEHDGVETWVSVNAQFEGPQAALLDVDIEAPTWATRRRAWVGNRTDPARRIAGAEAVGPQAVFVDSAPALAGAVVQTRVRLGPDLPSGTYVLRVRPAAGSVWLSAGVSRLGGRLLQNGTAWTYRTEGLGGKRLGITSPGRDPARDLMVEAVIPGRGPSRLPLEPMMNQWTIPVPADCIALRVRCVSAGPGPVAITLERPGAPRPLPLPTAESRDEWRTLVPGIHDVYRNPGLGAERARFRLLWEARDVLAPPPLDAVEVTLGGPGGRAPLAFVPRWIRDPRAFDAERPAALLWTSAAIEVEIPGGGSDAAVRVLADGFWVRWERKSGPPAHVAIHTNGSPDFFPWTSFLTRTRRATGLWDEEPRTDYVWPARETWTTPWEYSDGPSREWPELPLVAQDVTVLGVTEQFELTRPAAWRKPDNRPGPLWRPLPLGAETPAQVGDALGRAKFGSLRLMYQDAAIDGDRASAVEILVDGRPALTETLFRARGEVSVSGLAAGRHQVLLRPAAGIAAYRCGQWRVRTVDLPAEGDWQISSVWKARGAGEVVFEAWRPLSGEQAVVEVLSARPRDALWKFWSFRWEAEVSVGGLRAWIPRGPERHWVSPSAGVDAVRYGADGAAWTPAFRMAWELEPLAGARRVRGRLRGPLAAGDAVHLFRMSLEGGPLSGVDEVRKR
ncbi:MAG: hypothetical protein HYY18_04100 [Planctomycetes bacterium]|nr:hypothetical protein [Planctomycetota bacterium]